jgi:hypothetical protein
VALDEEDARSIIAGIFDVRVVLTEIALDVRAIRKELLDEDDDGEEEAEENH